MKLLQNTFSVILLNMLFFSSSNFYQSKNKLLYLKKLINCVQQIFTRSLFDSEHNVNKE